MKYKILFMMLIVVGLFFVYFLSIKTNELKSEAHQLEQKLTLVHCPTMDKYVNKSSIPAEIKVVSVNSTAQALDLLLQNPLTTIAVVGRKAKDTEITSDIAFIQTDTNALALVKFKETQNMQEILWKDIDYRQHDLVIEENEMGEKTYRTPFVYFHPQNQIVVKNLDLISGI